jgi:hypothetical protein
MNTQNIQVNIPLNFEQVIEIVGNCHLQIKMLYKTM